MQAEQELNNDWRKVASTIYAKPTDSKILGSVEIDVTELEKFIAQKRREGIKTTLTHIFTLIIARAIKEEIPELNNFVRRGKIVARLQIDAMVSLLLPGNQMGSVKIENADRLTISELAELMKTKIEQSRRGEENKTMQKKNILSALPWPFRQWFYWWYKTVVIRWGIPIFGLSANNFGSFVVSNIGSIGLDSGFGALLPSGNVSFVIVLGNVLKKPAVVDEKVVPRRIMSLSATLDHRIADGSHGGKLFRYIKRMVKNPEMLESVPE